MPYVHKDVLLRLCRARDALRETRERPLTVAQIAREAGISTFHFIRLFKACFGETPHQVRLEAQVGPCQMAAFGYRPFGDGCLHGSRVFEFG
jgi:AraC-like DNA-binding protein